MLTAAWAFAAADLLGSAVAIREDVPGEPLGLGLPVSVRTGVLVGWGAGVAAPWPMPVAALVAAARPGPRSHLVTAGLGYLCIAGTLVEPVTYGLRRRSPWVYVAIATNLAASVGLVLSARPTAASG